MTPSQRRRQDFKDQDERYIAAIIKEDLNQLNEDIYDRAILAEDLIEDSHNAITQKEIKEVVTRDQDYFKALKYVRSGKNWDKPDLGQFTTVRDELHEHKGNLMRDQHSTSTRCTRQ